MKKNLKVKGKTRERCINLFPIGSLCIDAEFEDYPIFILGYESRKVIAWDLEDDKYTRICLVTLKANWKRI
jgi:hypothetical protein